MDTSIRKTSTKTGVRKSSIRISSNSGKGTDSIRNTSSDNWGSKGSGGSDFMHWGGSLLGGKTSSSSIIKSSLESSLGSSNLINISQIFSSNLSISIHWSKSSMFSSFSSCKSSIELSLGSSNISCVLNWKGGGKSQKGSNDQFIHVCACSRESSK